MIDFTSEEFYGLPKNEKKQTVVNEFIKCRTDFEYYLDNYAYIRHPNLGILKMKAFDFQKDVTIPISHTLLHKRSNEAQEVLAKHKNKFDYNKWWKNLCEEKIEMSRLVPPEFHNFHRITAKHSDYSNRIDTILLKSRQTGLSTIFQQLCIWHANFHGDVYDLVMSQGDREAVKFLNDITSSFEELPAPLRAKKLNNNEHELWLSVTGSKRRKSGIQALPPTAKAGRSYSPNLVILDEFAEYPRADEVWTSISMSVSAGGIIVIIATPKGVGNLYHRIWEITNKSLTVSMPGEIVEDINEDEAALSVFRPQVVHWSQMPEEEFTRRGFRNPVDWYKHMKAKISMEKGTAGIAQELDLDFTSSGNTIDANIIKALRNNCIEASETRIEVLSEGVPKLVIYEYPQDNMQYVIGVDTGEGVNADYSTMNIVKVPDIADVNAFPQTVARYSSNTQSVRRYVDLVKNTGLLYNEAWLNIERNNHGHVLLTYFIDDGLYNEDRIFNRYDSTKNQFVKNVKGWNSQFQSRNLLIATLIDFLITSRGEILTPLVLADELKTFVQNKKGKWEAQLSYHDDAIIAFALSIIGCRLLAKYKNFLSENSSTYTDNSIITDDILIGSTNLISDMTVKTFIEKQKSNTHLKEKDEFDPEEYRQPIESREKNKRPETFKKDTSHKYMSRVFDFEEDSDIFVF